MTPEESPIPTTERAAEHDLLPAADTANWQQILEAIKKDPRFKALLVALAPFGVALFMGGVCSLEVNTQGIDPDQPNRQPVTQVYDLQAHNEQVRREWELQQAAQNQDANSNGGMLQVQPVMETEGRNDPADDSLSTSPEPGAP